MSDDTPPVDTLTVSTGQPVAVTVAWLNRHGITRCGVLTGPDGPTPHALIYQESYRSPVVLVVPGDVLTARDLGGTSGALTVLHHGPPLPDEESP